MSLRLLIVDDHPAFRRGIVAALEDEPDIAAVFEAEDTAGAITLARIEAPIHVALVDLRLRGERGGSCIEGLQRFSPDTRCLVLTAFNNDPEAVRAIQAGATAFLLKTCAMEELVTAIRRVASGENLIPEELADRIARFESLPDLSTREREVLRQLVDGRSNKEIADRLSISADTVKAHLKSIFRKLEVEDRTQAAVRAIQFGFDQSDA